MMQFMRVPALKYGSIALVVILLLGAVLRMFFGGEVTVSEDRSDLNFITYLSTQETWDTALFELTQRDMRYANAAWNNLNVGFPPSNDSDEIITELATLRNYAASARTEETLAQIRRENDYEWYIGGRDATAYFNIENFPKTRELLVDAIADVETHAFRAQHFFNRVRPSYLDEGLIPALAVPRSPSYPSEYAAKAFFLANVLSLLDPDHKQRYLEDASAITVRREVAGVNYPSDSIAGMTMAADILEILLQDQTFLDRFKAAQEEWK